MSQQQLTAAQLQHAEENYQKRVESKKLELESYQLFLEAGPPMVESLLPNSPWKSDLSLATYKLFRSKIARATVELEELELMLRGVRETIRQQESRIQVPNLQTR